MRNLLIGLTTILAWVPSTLLVIIAFFALIGAVGSILDLPILFSLKWIITSVFGIFGYIALTSVSWGLKLKHKTRLVFLILGLSALVFTYWSGVSFDGELFKLGSGLFEFYLFFCPAIFLIIHIVLHLVWVRKAI
ncbi:hypothetical protein [Pseudoalteromonas sp. OOF1S-7]|uniref:hypothetical protein n=1 Tax=Pseudoalteromonas sp. OOF1S-7 TaxID=2917757 RepID=UPI00083D2E53|nr:hypothetical protein [Pseudoalteromonas sp. OOF1S-7]MCG7537285.1 hypothetical protein [Pseudoalteromonas sp. OOF1S-7]ODB34751.1 hypothetical protein BB427_18625 [Pseudoalteromonas sp. BMB]